MIILKMNDYEIKRMDGENVLILGGMGAIGSNIAHKIIPLGAKVTIYDNFMEGTGANPFNIHEIKDKLELVKGDIRNFNSLSKVIKDKSIIFNCAAQVSHLLSMQDPFLDIDINCLGHINVLECCRKFNDSAKIIYTGTRGQNGEALYNPINEDHPDNPTDIYGANKLASELYHFVYHKAYGMWATSLRLTNTYGPRAQMINTGHSIINWIISQAMLGKTIPVFEPGTQLRDINYMEDAVDALILSSQNNKSNGQMFLLGSGKGIAFLNLVDTIVKIAGKGSYELTQWPKERKNIETGSVVVDYSKINKMLGWYPKTMPEEGIKKTISFYKRNFNDYFK